MEGEAVNALAQKHREHGQQIMEHPIQILEDIEFLTFPCMECGHPTLHMIGMRPYGVGLKLPLMKNPLATTHKAYFAICGVCTMLNARLEKEDVDKLRDRIIPKSIHILHPVVAGFYSLEMLTSLDDQLKDNPERLEFMKRMVKAYRLEL